MNFNTDRPRRSFRHVAPLFALIVGAFATGCGDDDDAEGGASGSGDTGASGGASADGDNGGATTRTDSGPESGGTDSSSSGATADATGTETTTTTAAATDTGTSGSDTGSASESDTGGTTGGGQFPELCEAPGNLTPCDADSDDPFQAIGLNCPGTPNDMIPILNESFWSEDEHGWRVASQLGTAVDAGGQPLWRAREGEKFLIISSGRVDPPDDAGVITQAPGHTQYGTDNSTANPDNKTLPAPISPELGSNGGQGGTPFVNCDGSNDCSDSINAQWLAGGGAANDLLWFQFETLVPKGTHGFSFDFAYFSAEFPEWVDSTYNDVFLVWSNSESYTGNLCFVNDQPCTVTALWPVAHTEADPALVGTGFDTVGGGTGWYQAKGSAQPGELLQLTWAVFDMGDTVLDTAVIIDNFKWDCEGCTPSEVDPCIGIDPV